MLVLESGRTMYFGKVADLPDYMEEKLGFEIPKYSNPCDFILDKVNCDFQESTKDADTLYDYFRENVTDEVMQQIETINNQESEVEIDAKSTKNLFYQIWVLLCKNWRNHLRNYAIYWVRIAMYSMLCICLGTLYWDIGTSSEDKQDRISILFFVAAFLTFMSISGMPAFCEERGIYLRERANNHYSTLAYSVANFLSSLPWIFLISLISSALIHGMIQSRSGWDKFAIYLFNLFMALLVAESIMVMISAISSIFMVGLAVGAGVLGLFMIVCGFFLLPSNIPAGWKWVHYAISFHTYSFRVFMYNEFHDFNEGEIDGNAVLELYEMEDADIGFCFGILAIMMVVYRIVFYMLLRFFVRKQK